MTQNRNNCLVSRCRLGLVWLALATGPVSADTVIDERCQQLHASGSTYWSGETGGGDAYDRFLCLLGRVPAAQPTALDAPGTPLELAPLAIRFTALADAALVDVSTTVEVIDTLNFGQPPKTDAAQARNLRQFIALHAGSGATWMMTPGGVVVRDARSGRWSFSAKVTPDKIRPQDVVVDAACNCAWFFGRELLQYEIATHRILRYQAAGKSYRVIRKLAAIDNGLWLATDAGVFFFDTHKKTLRRLVAAERVVDQPWSQVAADRTGAWLSGGSGRLIRVAATADRITASLSEPLGDAAPVELVTRDGDLWFLLSRDKGRSEQLAVARHRELTVQMTRTTLHNLREGMGQLVGAAHDQLYVIDPAAAKLRSLRASLVSLGERALGSQTLFTGASYVNATSTGEVTHVALDLSKGWIKPATGLIFPAWMPGARASMFQDLPVVIATAVTPREIWFLLALQFETAVFHYDVERRRAKIYLPSTQADSGFAIDSRTASVSNASAETLKYMMQSNP